MKKMKNIFQGINRRSVKYGSISFILIVAVIAIAVVLNLMVDTVQKKNLVKTKFDLTSNQLYSLGDKSKEILKGLNKDVEIYGLFDVGTINSDESLTKIKEVLNQYQKYPHIKVTYIDPDKNPGFVKKIDPSGIKDIKKGDFVVKSGNKVRKLLADEIIYTDYDQSTGQAKGSYFTGEQGFTGAIKFVISDKTPVVYFTSGHGEGNADSDYRNLRAQLEANNYEVKSINLVTSAKIPEDAEILMVASPKSDLSADDKARIKDFLNNGGKAIFLFDSQESDVKYTQFDDLLKDFNVGLNYDKVKENDQKRFLPKNPYAILLDVPKSAVIPIDRYQLVLSNSRSINILKNQKDYIIPTSLMKTSNTAVGEQIDKSRGNDNKGPLDLAVAVENKGGMKSSKIIVMGNGLFISDSAVSQNPQYYQYGYNFFTMSLNWMMDKKNDVVIEPKTMDTVSMKIGSASQALILAFVVVIIFPLLILGSGLFVWMRRRHL